MPKRLAAALTLFCLAFGAPAFAAETLDATPRTAVISAFPPEWTLLQQALQDRKDHDLAGMTFVTGTIEGKPVLLFLSGISMVNAAMTTQLALDHFAVERIVFSGIAGGVDPGLEIGDVVIPERWSEYLEAVFAREKDGGYELPDWADKPDAHFGMIFPQPVKILRKDNPREEHDWFPVDPALLALAKTVADGITLQNCAAQNCLDHRPKIVVGGNGVSGQAFVDNKAFREYVLEAFDAKVLDMESAAVAHVAYVNGKPFIAFRSLSDLAGGGEGENQIRTFFQLASDNAATVVKAFLKALP
ncbi:MAG TPA: 5'-methylthioadenosine/S-adenosylhomocysteine nucleosidase [Hypericibacter adhaerens]|uniref:5'-methylthioadenosine/S-adenosylhomocysteine nucleosidase n=1 Tax=Hypericibacter adhaerens TaxID=2602016 RepID=UPI002CAD228B|nr:5'-methylthioadenosine/S-adenosylhomocysteine nucleosidase [Hypericibacter adhaerens]HWA44126.1 5'-methylthioadenosine/S-adenosylhomocysteine nucleosidase [Hypericibacter adhaerens]